MVHDEEHAEPLAVAFDSSAHWQPTRYYLLEFAAVSVLQCLQIGVVGWIFLDAVISALAQGCLQMGALIIVALYLLLLLDVGQAWTTLLRYHRSKQPHLLRLHQISHSIVMLSAVFVLAASCWMLDSGRPSFPPC